MAGAGSQVIEGKLAGYLLYLSPSHDREGITVFIELPYPDGCVNIGGTTTNVTFDGAAGVTRNGGQDACFGHLHGMYVYVSSDQKGGALGLLRHVHVLGPDPANWTTQPLG